MITEGFLTLGYLLAGGLFILSLGGLSTQQTARRGNLAGMAGMAVAFGGTLLSMPLTTWPAALLAVALGGLIGIPLARRVAMTEMPQLVAVLHSFVGIAAVLVGLSTFLHPPAELALGAHGVLHTLEVFADVTIGAITFAGSVVAWAKLDGRMSGKPLLLPARHKLNLGLLVVILLLSIPTALLGSGFVFLVFAALLACVLGAHLVLAIGGADMPVVVSLLNSYSGWTAAAAGFMLSNDLLIITGALVGSSGAILSTIMCRAMNRSIWNVVFGGFGTDDAKPSEQLEELPGEVRAVECPELAELLVNAREVMIIPGYGLAVARAQNAVHDLVRELQKRNVRVRFAIHPVAGRLPGHMNVLLAESGVSYDIVHEMEEVNEDFPHVDVSIVVGANDIVNPAAQTDAHSPIYGMPVLEVWKSGTCVVMKRSMNVGYAGIGNPLFFHDRARMLFGDAKDKLDELVAAVRAA